MEVITIPYEDLDPMFQKSADRGYSWGCQCGERYTNQVAAEGCRKCRTYLEGTPTPVYFTPREEAGK